MVSRKTRFTKKLTSTFKRNGSYRFVLRWFFGEVAETLGMVRGTFSGNINMLASPLTLDYNMFLNWGQKEKEAAKADLKERLDLLSPEKTLEREAQMVDNIIKARKAVPLKIYVR